MRDMYASNEFNKLLKKYEIDDCVKMYCGKTRVGVVERGLIAAAGLKNVLLGTNDVVKAMSHKEFVDWGSVPIPDTTPTKSIGNVEVVASE